MKLSFLVVLVSLLWAGAYAQPSSDCTSVIISMSPCLNYITGNTTTPSSSCCSTLGNVVKSDPMCLCQVLNGGGSSLGLNINQTQALALPTACNVQTPSISLCNAAAPTADSPTASTPGSRGPNSGGDSSDGSSVKLSFSLVVVFLVVASYVPGFSKF
ncbi:Non-specific lipid transfer protein GPI-anchored 5 [Ranunculus cassubicifolius]